MKNMSKYYFEHNAEYCYSKERHLEQMKENGEHTREVFEAKRETGQDYFFCKEFGEVGMVGESCGKQCSEYKPRNGKNGRCVHSGYCYEQTEKRIILKL